MAAENRRWQAQNSPTVVRLNGDLRAEPPKLGDPGTFDPRIRLRLKDGTIPTGSDSRREA